MSVAIVSDKHGSCDVDRQVVETTESGHKTHSDTCQSRYAGKFR